ncbi:hypothetical protein GL263_10420 [Streptomyces durbertensis]|uniref:RsbT co-antagonist protein RsbRD N-terminal domain-containing protein n=1 Tax=Streptomyces durbertensis TaxID=2448886 RepID=A0ABR6EF64_9ACTN|nr:hypothetical protein [Streptomyces durbertensis]MBB1243967.1 hypothetical protein [Streptomyces durbertensis]
MGIDADSFLCRLAQELRPQAEESADLLLERLSDDMPELWEHKEMAALAPEETAGHINRFLDVLEGRIEVTEVEAPPEALAIARQAAGRGVPISRLLRAYRLGHMVLVQLIQAEAARLDDGELRNAAMLRLVESAFAYVDRESEQIVVAYQEERGRRLQLVNETSRRIGTSLDTVRTAEELAEFGTDGFADLVTVDLPSSCPACR